MPALTSNVRPVVSGIAGRHIAAHILRFRSDFCLCFREEMSQYTAHLDLHIRLQMKKKDNARKAQSR